MKRVIFNFLFVIILCAHGFAQERVKLYDVFELTLQGKNYKIIDSPVRDIQLITTWQHESGSPAVQIHGFYDGDGEGNPEGDVFKVRFCPTKTGMWTLKNVQSNDTRLNGQKQGKQVEAIISGLKGFWEVDIQSPGARWYKRSDGSHQYIIGNTLYSFLSETYKDQPTGGDIKTDVERNAQYFKKIRFSLTGDIFSHPTEKPFLDENGYPTDNGDYSYRPNPKWFLERVDLAVKTSFDYDLIADLILNGPDSETGRSMLTSEKNNGDYTPWLRYIAARYGSYPNVWICLCNEYDIRSPRFIPEKMKEVGITMKELLPYHTPLSVHGRSGNWNDGANGDWCDHIIIQKKLKKLKPAAEMNKTNYFIGGGKPVINDELAYEGEGDGWVEPDVIEAILGAFAGGGYGSAGYKTASKEGHYFSGNFKAKEHTSADNLKWFRNIVDNKINFWKMQPIDCKTSVEGVQYCGIFYNIDPQFCSMEREGQAYLLFTNKSMTDMEARLPQGKYSISIYDLIGKKVTHHKKVVSGNVMFSSPDSRACLIQVKNVDD